MAAACWCCTHFLAAAHSTATALLAALISTATAVLAAPPRLHCFTGLTFTPGLYACGVDIVGPSHVRTLLQSVPPYW